MLARSSETLPSGRTLRGGGVYEPKWDGYAMNLPGAATASSAARSLVDVIRWCSTPESPDVATAARRQLAPVAARGGAGR